MIRKIAVFLFFMFVIAVSLSAQDRFALVIGNNSYSGLSSLKNPVNDAVDIAGTLENLGFKVELVQNGNLGAMERAVINLKNKLSVNKNSIGFFYYAGHGVQSGGQNFLIPSGANIADEAFLKTKSLSTQAVMDLLQSAGNNLNMVILDACRDNPFSWSRSSSRGLSVVGSQPPGSIIVYATSAGSTAKDGTGRNGMFTTELLKHLKTPGIDVTEVFRLTGAGVRDASGGSQIPAVYNQYFDKIYLAGTGSAAVRTPGFTEEAAKYGSVKVSVVGAGTVYVDGVRMGAISANRSATLSDITTGTHQLEIRYGSKTERKSVTVNEGRITSAGFTWVDSSTVAVGTRDSSSDTGPEDGFIFVQGGTFEMGSTSGDTYEEPVHSVTISSFYMSSYEVTQKEWHNIMGTSVSQQRDKANPEYSMAGEGNNNPMYFVSWYDAVEYCNALSREEGLTPVYNGSGGNIKMNINANGYRLPTEAEWEYAARGGNSSPAYTYAGSNNIGQVAWYKDNSGGLSHPVGGKQANELGLYDMTGNVWEWCWDRNGNYSSGNLTDPTGEPSGAYRVLRGSSWLNDATFSRTTNRSGDIRSIRGSFLGFRLVRRP